MKNRISKVRKLLEEYSPLALLVMVLPFFIDYDHQLSRRLILLLCAGPGLLLALLNPKSVFKNPVLLLVMLFVTYFSIQDIRGLEEISFPEVRGQIVRAAVLILPAILLSFATPERKLYALPFRLILLVSAGITGFSLFAFYADNPFPTARFELMVGKYIFYAVTAMLCGFCAVIAGALFLQSGRRVTRWNAIELICLPVLLAGMLYTHTRSSFLAVLAILIASLFTLKNRWRKLLCLYSVVALTLLIYAITLHGAESAPTASGKRIFQREGGVFNFNSGTNGRLSIWKCHLSRLNREKKWLAGFGLGMNNFVQDVPPEQRPLYDMSDYGWEIHTHSGYVWALYFGGIIGLGLLLLLLGAAGIHALREGESGYLGASLIMFCAVFMIADIKSLLTGNGGITYLLFWIPMGLAAARCPQRTEP